MSPIAHLMRRTALAGTLCALASLSVAGLGLSATPALAGSCPNDRLRSENNSTRLPECRAYEMVTPPYTEGFPVSEPTFNDGGALGYVSFGSFAGNASYNSSNQYVATRSSAGWETTALNPPSMTFFMPQAGVSALSADLRYSLWNADRLEPPADAGQTYYLRGPDGSMTRVGDTGVGNTQGIPTQAIPFIEGASADLSHIVFAHFPGSGSSAVAALYEFVGTGNEGPPVAVSVENSGNQFPGQFSEAGYEGMSADGRVIVFGINGGLWARVGGSATVAVSGSECTRTSGDPGGACNAAAAPEFAGMATDGSRVYFTTAQQLIDGDTDETNDLYFCEIPAGAPAPVGTANLCSSLTEVSHTTSAAEVQSVVKVSADGSHVYFIAKGVLAGNLGTNDASAVAGDDNLYVWEKDAVHPTGQTTFVTKLESGIGLKPETTTDGRYLVFSTASRLLASDTDEAPDVYRYDAQTQTLLRLSTDIFGAGGNEPGVEATLAFTGSAISADASTVVFDTSEALSPADTDGTQDVYEWHEGHVSLISNGGGTAIGITPSGQDIFFITGGIELDKGKSYFDARIDGGFPATAPAPCSGEACQGAPTPLAQPPGTSASAAFNGPGSPLTAEIPPSAEAKPKRQAAAQKLAKALRACRAKHDKKRRKACEKRARHTSRRAR